MGGTSTVVLGGIGGDSHSVGIHVLRRALVADGYDVRFLGTQNSLPALFAAAEGADVVLVSCMDGHARHYLRSFAELREAFASPDTRFYLGGNPTLRGDDRAASDFVAMGFARVFTGFVDVTTLLRILRDDRAQQKTSCAPPVTDGPRSVAALFGERDEVLAQWETGAAARALDANAAFLEGRPSFARAQADASARGEVLVQPRSGVPTVEGQIDVFARLEAGGARVLSYQVDSLTRNNDHIGVARALAEHARGGVGLNGFPVVNQGVAALRAIATRVGVPLQTRHSTRDPRLLAELSYAGGTTAFEGGAVSYNIPYYKRYPLAEAIPRWQFVDRLTALYADRYGVVLDREFFGTLTATLVPPCIAIAVDLLEGRLAVAQGVRSVSLGYAEQGNRTQDVAAIRAMRRLAATFLPGVQLNTVFHQYMAAFPPDRARAAELIRESACTGALAGATRIMLKTAAEAISIPTADDNVEALALAAAGIAAARACTLDEPRVEAETRIICREVEAILGAVLEAGAGDVARGVVAAFARGLLDVPFAPSVFSRGEVMTARDVDGAVRFLQFGQLPFGRDLRAFHDTKMNERLAFERLERASAYKLVEQDVLRIPRGDYPGWPLGQGRVAPRDRLASPRVRKSASRDGRAKNAEQR